MLRVTTVASSHQFIPNLESREEVRGFLVKSLERDIIGPSWLPNKTQPNLQEELDLGSGGQPDRYYLTGYLSPLKKNEQDGVVGIMASSDDAPPEEAYGLKENEKTPKQNSYRRAMPISKPVGEIEHSHHPQQWALAYCQAHRSWR